jgi:membrane protein DedA with SNARE-associated domain
LIIDQQTITALLETYGYWVIFFMIALESAGLPLPGETVLIGAAIYARMNEVIDLKFIVFAAASGAVIGDNLGYFIGYKFGYLALRRYGPKLGLTIQKQRLIQYLFYRWGGLVVLFGRFITLLRVFAALMAGASHVPFLRFFIYNSLGGILWATCFGYGAYTLTENFEKVQTPTAKIIFVLLLIGLFFIWRFYKKNAQILNEEADALFGEESLT